MNTQKGSQSKWLWVKMSGIRQTVGFDRKTKATYCSLARHFGLHSHRHGHRHNVEEHTPRYDIGTGLYCSAVLKKTHQKKEKKALVITSRCWWHCILWNAWNKRLHLSCSRWIWLLTAIGLIRAIAAVKYMVTSLGQVVAGPISTPQLCTLGVIWKIKSSSGPHYALKSAWQLCAFQPFKMWEAWRMGRKSDSNLRLTP